MRRRAFVAGLGSAAAAAIARPALVRAASATTLRFIPQVDLAFLDPHWTTANVTRNHGYMVFDTLYGIDGTFTAQPQMVEGHRTDGDGRLWDLSLRDGLLWHDGEKVLARDCVASIRRWSQNDAFGGALVQATDELSAPSDRVIRFRLKRPFPLLPDALAKGTPYMPAMMPERLARTPVGQQVTEMVGSGPFRFKADERLQGARNVYQRFEKYAPRADGVSDWVAGPKRAFYDRVVWTTTPDTATASAALQNNEQDWWEQPAHDLLPLLKATGDINIVIRDPTGVTAMLRPNHLQAPFNNPAIRRALWKAINQTDFMTTVVGDNADLTYTPLGFFCPKTAMATDAGLEVLKGPRDYEAVKRDLKAAGYAGERVVLLVPTDYLALKALGDVAADMLKRCGLNVDYVATDWGTMLQRRTKQLPVDQGGWSVFVSSWTGLDWMNPATDIALRGNGTAGYAGWYKSDAMEALRSDWIYASDPQERVGIAHRMQAKAMDDVPFWPLGQYLQPTAHRKSITGVSSGFTTFWNVRPA